MADPSVRCVFHVKCPRLYYRAPGYRRRPTGAALPGRTALFRQHRGDHHADDKPDRGKHRQVFGSHRKRAFRKHVHSPTARRSGAAFKRAA